MPASAMSSYRHLPEWLVPIARRTAERAEALSREPFHGYAPQRIPNVSADTLRSYEMGRETGMAFPYISQARQAGTRGAQPFYESAHHYMNPYEQHVIDAMRQDALRNFQEGTLPFIQGRFARFGASNTAGRARMERQARRDMQEQLLRQQNLARHQGYQNAAQTQAQDAARMLMLGRQLGDLGTTAQASHGMDVEMLRRQGLEQQARQQQLRDLEYQEYLRELNYPHENLARLSSVLHGVPYSHSEQSVRRETRPPEPSRQNTWGQLGNFGANVLAARLARS